MITFVTWLWGAKYSSDDVHRLARGISRNTARSFDFVCLSDRSISWSGREPNNMNSFSSRAIIDTDLIARRGCFARLRLFDPEWLDDVVTGSKERVVSMDLDTIVTGNVDPLFDRPEPLVIMAGANKVNPCPFNGALMMLRPGAHPEVWDDFTIDAAAAAPFHEFPDDQGWIHHKLPGAATWQVGQEHGVYVWQKRGWPGGEDLPKGARLVTFVNKTPRDVINLSWVRENWK